MDSRGRTSDQSRSTGFSVPPTSKSVMAGVPEAVPA